MALSQKEQKTVKNLMMLLGITEQEAIQVVEDDKRIDRGEKLFELTEEQKANEKKARLTGERVAIKPTKRERKADTQKQDIITVLSRAIVNNFGVRVDVANEEREFAFELNGKKYKVVLSCPRN